MSILVRLLILAALAVVPPALLAAWHVFDKQHDEVAAASEDTLRVAQLVAAEQKRIVNGARQLLLGLSLVPVIRQGDAAACGATMRRVIGQLTAYTVIGVASPEGRIWCSSAEPGTDVSRGPGYRGAVETGSFLIGGYRLGSITGRKTLHFAQPVYGDGGQLLGVLLAGLDLARLALDLGKTPLPADTTLTLLDPTGTILVNLPDESLVGQQLPPALRAGIEGEGARVAELSWLDGKDRTLALVPIGAEFGAPSLVAVGRNRAQVLGEALEGAVELGVLSVLVLLVALMGIWWFGVRFIRAPLARLTAMAESWKEGDTATRAGRISGAIEFEKLGRAFEAMADGISERKRRLRDALESTTDSVLAIDKEWRVTYVNQRAFDRLNGRDIVGRELWDEFPTIRDEETGRELRRAMSERVPTRATLFYAPLGGHFEVNIFPAADGGITLFIREVTEQVLAREKLKSLAYRDTLTGLPNLASFREMTERARGEADTVALVRVNLDQFKDVNDTVGHSVGDEVLQEVARRLTEALGERGTLARLGGDEFGALLVGPAVHEGEAVARDMVAALDAHPIAVRGLECRVRASAGVAVLPVAKGEAGRILANAELALRRAKASGGSGVEIFVERDRHEYEARRRLEDEVDRAAENGEFELWYQPQVRLSDRALTGAEALLRWRHPHDGILTPDRFIETLERSRHVRQVGTWIVEEACRQAAAWRNAGLSIRIGVNLFAEQLVAGDLDEVVEAALTKSGLPPEALELELTENIALKQEGMLAPLRALRARGVSIAFDDFGTGFASLNALKDFPLTRLKIDRGFIGKLWPGTHDAAIVEAVLALARSLGLAVTAEGVETEEQEAFLSARGCTEAQGYRYGRPSDPQGFLAAVLRGQARPGQPAHLRVLRAS